MANNTIPKDWIKYSKYSEELVGGIFLVSKTPLTDSFDSCLLDDDIYKPKMLFDYAEEKFHLKIGLFIDLTPSDKFIKKKDIEQFNCQFEKITVPSVSKHPKKPDVFQFKNIVNSFIKLNTGGIIAVSCLGFDLSGFFIISYLISELEMSISKAIETFERARPPGTINEDTRKEIHYRYSNGQHLSNPYKKMRDNKPNFNRVKKENKRNFSNNNNFSKFHNDSKDSKEKNKLEKFKKEKDEKYLNILNEDYALTDDDVNQFLEVVRRKTQYRPHNINFNHQKTLELITLSDMTHGHVQIYHNGISTKHDMAHYVTIYYNGSYVFIYDSLCSIKSTTDFNLELNDYLKMLFPNMDPSKYFFPIVKNYERKPMDSGVFCCAFITSICIGNNPEYEYYFSESMRPNLVNIIIDRQLYAFESNYTKQPIIYNQPVISATPDLKFEFQTTLFNMQYPKTEPSTSIGSYHHPPISPLNDVYNMPSTSRGYAQVPSRIPLNGGMNTTIPQSNFESMSNGNNQNHTQTPIYSTGNNRSNTSIDNPYNSRISSTNFGSPNNLSTINVNSHNQMTMSSNSVGGSNPNDQSRVPLASPFSDNFVMPSISPMSFISEIPSTPNFINPVMGPVREEELAMEVTNDEDEDENMPPIVHTQQEIFQVQPQQQESIEDDDDYSEFPLPRNAKIKQEHAPVIKTEPLSSAIQDVMSNVPQQQISIEDDDDEYSEIPLPYNVKIKQEHGPIKMEPLSGIIQVVKSSDPPNLDSQDLNLILSKLDQKVQPTSSADRVQAKIREWMKCQNSVEFPGVLPNLVTRATMNEIFDKKDYMVSWKPDGIRFLLYVENKDNVFLINRLNKVQRVKSIFLPRADNLKHMIEETLLDGEMVIDVTSKGEKLRFLIFDIIRYENKDLTSLPFSTRLECITQRIIKPYDDFFSKATPNLLTLFIYYKYAISLDKIFKIMEAKPHKSDGLIFCHKNGIGPVYKWMPVQKCTVDVLCTSFTLFLRRENKEDSKVIQCGTINQSETTQGIDNEIIECYWDFGPKWIFLRRRPDKKYPNTVEEFERIKEFLYDPVTESHLEKYVQDHF